jgi:two-component system response regulator (stage 0 sporulation protein F)
VGPLNDKKLPETGKTILVVDDQAGIRRLIADVLKEDGYRVLLAENGEAALGFLKDCCPDLILLDMRMPGMSGLETLNRIRGRNYTGPIVLMTAFDDLDSIAGTSEVGASHFLSKPFDIFELKSEVKRVLRMEYS